MTTELATINDDRFPVAQDNATILAQNLGGERMSAFDLPTIRRTGPTGLKWEVGDSMNPESIEEIRGVILWTAFRRRRYEGEFGSNPVPLCIAYDGWTGEGVPGGDCSKCPRNGKDCRSHRPVLILREGQKTPEAMNVACTSLTNFRTWLFSLSEIGSGKVYYQVEVSLRFASDMTKGAVKRPIARIVPKTIGVLSGEMLGRVAALAQQMQRDFSRCSFNEVPDVDDDEPTEV